ncbi:MAG: hypothetical protein LBU03_03025, partial [Tannerellaceae bacterium]|nr:hypothetical protein [Tannerellaceae bacterium]
MNTHLFTPTSCKRPLACLLAALFFAAAPARAQVLPYADDFKNQTDYLLIRDYYNLGEQIGAEHWPSLDFEVEDIVIGRNSTNDTYAWAYLTSRICVFVVGVDYFEYNDNEMWV